MKFIYVHLGPRKNKHLILAIKRNLEIFPENETWLIHDDEFSIEIHKLRKYPNFNTFKYVSGNELTEYRKKCDFKFRDGFWWFSLERLLSLKKFHESYPNESILHVESDVLLFPNFPIEKIENNMYSLIWCRYNEKADVAALLYSRNINTSKFLYDELIINALISNEFKSEMSLLSQIAHSHKDKVGIFSMFNQNDKSSINSLNNFAGLDPKIHELNFDGIFDGAAIGMWLTGQDPMNFFGVSKLHNTDFIQNGDSYIDPSKMEYSVLENGCLLMKTNKVQIPIYSLHAHSKNLDLFGKNWNKKIEYFVKLSYSKKTIYKFNFRASMQFLIDITKRRKILSTIKHIPLVKKFKKS